MIAERGTLFTIFFFNLLVKMVNKIKPVSFALINTLHISLQQHYGHNKFKFYFLEKHSTKYKILWTPLPVKFYFIQNGPLKLVLKQKFRQADWRHTLDNPRDSDISL